MAPNLNSKTGSVEHALAVIRPALLLASKDFLVELRQRLRDEGITAAVANHDSAAIFNWMMPLVGLQGISDAIAFAYSEEHGSVRFQQIADALVVKPSCPKLRSFWSFFCCRYRKSAQSCDEPDHFDRCPLPKFPLRKGLLNEAAFSMFLFIRDVCKGDLVGWLDRRLSDHDPGLEAPDRARLMRDSLLEPFDFIAGFGRKLASMILSELLLAGDPDRERWVTTGGSMIAVDSLVHNFLHRTGILARYDAQHLYGASCYAPGCCADIVERFATKIDASKFNPAFPKTFPRFVQHAIWGFCAEGPQNICNGRQIDDRLRCQQVFCPAFNACDRVALRGA